MSLQREMLKEITALTRLPVSDMDFITAYNRAVNDLEHKYDTAKPINKLTIVCDDLKGEYQLSPNNLGVQKVLNSYGDFFTNYHIQGRNISFGSPGTYTIFEKVQNTPIKTMDSPIDISFSYQYAISKFIAYYLLRPTDPDTAEKYRQDYLIESETVNNSLRRIANPNRRVYAPRFR